MPKNPRTQISFSSVYFEPSIFFFFNFKFFIAIGLHNFQTNSTILQFPETMRTGLIRVCVLSVCANSYISYDTVKICAELVRKHFKKWIK